MQEFGGMLVAFGVGIVALFFMLLFAMLSQPPKD